MVDLNLLNVNMDKGSKEAFIAFIKKAVADKRGKEGQEVYAFLVRCFIEADSDQDGAVDPIEFDQMIEVAAAAPRRYGLAPSSNVMYKTPEERLAARKVQFYTMDTNHDNTISLEEWLKYTADHLVKKVADI